MTEPRRATRFKFNAEEAVQWDDDIALIRRTFGRLPYKYVALSAVHRWANSIRDGRAQDDARAGINETQ